MMTIDELDSDIPSCSQTRSSLQVGSGAAFSECSQFTGSNVTEIAPSTFNLKRLDSHFRLGDIIHKGKNWEMVKAMARDCSTEGKTRAIKKIRRWGPLWNTKSALLREVEILKMLSHPKVVSIFHFFSEEPKYYYTVLEHLEGGDLLDHIAGKEYSEATVRNTCFIMIETIAYLHKKGIVHRDINLRSFVLAKPDDVKSIRLTGFGEACSFSKGPVNAPIRWYADRFVAPEIVKKESHGAPVDMWNLGRVVYVLLTGHDLISRGGRLRVMKKRGDLKNRMEQNWGGTSEEAKDFVRALLEKDPAKRMTAELALVHKWMGAKPGSLASDTLEANIRKIQLCNIRHKLRAALDVYFASCLLTCSLVPRNPGDSVFLRAYEEQEELGKGSFSCVCKVRLREGGVEIEAERAKENGCQDEKVHPEEEEFAAKKIKRKGLRKTHERMVFNEVCFLRKLNHDNVIKLHEFYHDDPKHYYIVLELMRGGELLRQIVEKENKTKLNFNEEEVRDICRVIFKAVEYIHSKDIVHRDLKPENILLADENDTKSIRIADFGLSCYLRDKHAFDGCGTPRYTAPEIIRNEPHGKPVDMWSLGVIVYNMLSGGQFPFGNPKYRKRDVGPIAQKRGLIKQNHVDPRYTRRFVQLKIMGDILADIRSGLKHHCWSHVSEEAKDFIDKLLTVDPSKRLTASEAVNHGWLKDIDGSKLASNSLNNLRLFNARRKLRGAINMYLATHGLGFDQQKQGDQPEDELDHPEDELDEPEDDQTNKRLFMTKQPRERGLCST